MGKLSGRTAVVTGGAKGIGRHYSQALAAEGAEVVIVDIADGESLAKELAAKFGRNASMSVTCDVSDEAPVQRLTGQVIALEAACACMLRPIERGRPVSIPPGVAARRAPAAHVPQAMMRGWAGSHVCHLARRARSFRARQAGVRARPRTIPGYADILGTDVVSSMRSPTPEDALSVRLAASVT
jgi:NAD(P)-dependent dehydrogenase (short-subunit alcohol dehydrogenase family)